MATSISPGLPSEVSFVDLSAEMLKHNDSAAVHALLADLQEHRTDLKSFCRSVRVMVGAQVLLLPRRQVRPKIAPGAPQDCPRSAPRPP